MTVHWNRQGKSATIEVGDNSIHLAEHEWSKWVNLDFEINLLVRVHGMAQLYLINAGQELQLYISPVNWRPDSPPAPMSYPRGFSADSPAARAPTGRLAGRKRPGRSTRIGSTRRCSWTTSSARSTTARR